MLKKFKKQFVSCAPEGEASGGGGASGGTPPAAGQGGEQLAGPTAEERAALAELKLADVVKERDALKAHNDRVLTDHKKAQQAVDAAKEKERMLADQKAREEGNLQALLQHSEAQRIEKEKALSDMQRAYSDEKAEQLARTISTKLASGPDAAELLTESIKGRIRFDMDTKQYVILGPDGNPTYATVADFEKELDNGSKYSVLLKSSQRSGGGATGARGGASQNKVLSRSQFSALSPQEKTAKMASGWKVVDD